MALKTLRPVVLGCFLASEVLAQRGTSAPPATAPSAPVTAPPTKLEAFKPAAGSVVTFGYDDLYDANGVTLDVRELRDSKGPVVRGVTVEVSKGQYNSERSFVDGEELPELVRGIDALLAVKKNPTSFGSFEVRYTTRGDLQITAFDQSDGSLGYAIQAGRITHSQVFVSDSDLLAFKHSLETAISRLQKMATK